MAIRQSAEVNRIRQEFADTEGRDPTDEELSDHIGISVQRIKNVRKMVRASVSEGGMSEPADEDSIAASPGVSTANKLTVAEEAVYDSLSPRDKAIFDWKTGKNGKTLLSNQVIAQRLGVTPALISQRSQQIAMQIQDLHDRNIL
jgi:RNA polymerase primary sigma factor